MPSSSRVQNAIIFCNLQSDIITRSQTRKNEKVHVKAERKIRNTHIKVDKNECALTLEYIKADEILHIEAIENYINEMDMRIDITSKKRKTEFISYCNFIKQVKINYVEYFDTEEFQKLDDISCRHFFRQYKMIDKMCTKSEEICNNYEEELINLGLIGPIDLNFFN